PSYCIYLLLFFFQAEDGIRDFHVTGVQTCALPISRSSNADHATPMRLLSNGITAAPTADATQPPVVTGPINTAAGRSPPTSSASRTGIRFSTVTPPKPQHSSTATSAASTFDPRISLTPSAMNRGTSRSDSPTVPLPCSGSTTSTATATRPAAATSTATSTGSASGSIPVTGNAARP